MNPYIYIETLEVIGLLGRTKVYCSSMDAIETVANPTFFCKFQGWLTADCHIVVLTFPKAQWYNLSEFLSCHYVFISVCAAGIPNIHCARRYVTRWLYLL